MWAIDAPSLPSSDRYKAGYPGWAPLQIKGTDRGGGGIIVAPQLPALQGRLSNPFRTAAAWKGLERPGSGGREQGAPRDGHEASGVHSAGSEAGRGVGCPGAPDWSPGGQPQVGWVSNVKDAAWAGRPAPTRRPPGGSMLHPPSPLTTEYRPRGWRKLRKRDGIYAALPRITPSTFPAKNCSS